MASYMSVVGAAFPLAHKGSGSMPLAVSCSQILAFQQIMFGIVGPLCIVYCQVSALYEKVVGGDNPLIVRARDSTIAGIATFMSAVTEHMAAPSNNAYIGWLQLCVCVYYNCAFLLTC